MQTKRIKGLSSVLIIDDIEGLSTYECEQLQVGDIVALEIGEDEKMLYQVAMKSYREHLILVCVDGQVVREVHYAFSGGEWLFDISFEKDIVSKEDVKDIIASETYVFEGDDISEITLEDVGDAKVIDWRGSYYYLVNVEGNFKIFVEVYADDDINSLQAQGIYVDETGAERYTYTLLSSDSSISIANLWASSSEKGKFLMVNENSEIEPMKLVPIIDITDPDEIAEKLDYAIKVGSFHDEGNTDQVYQLTYAEETEANFTTIGDNGHTVCHFEKQGNVWVLDHLYSKDITTLYAHELSFTGTKSGSGACHSLPLCLITTRATPYSFNESFSCYMGFNCCAINDDMNVLGSRVAFDVDSGELTIGDYAGNDVVYTNLTFYYDDVEKL